MKKICLFIVLVFVLMSCATTYTSRETVTDQEKIARIIDEYYPDLMDYYNAGVMEISSIQKQETSAGTTEYDIKYKFVKKYYEGQDLVNILKEQYPDLYRMNAAGMVKDVSIYKFVDKNTGQILNYVAYNKNNRAFRNPRPGVRTWLRRR